VAPNRDGSGFRTRTGLVLNIYEGMRYRVGDCRRPDGLVLSRALQSTISQRNGFVGSADVTPLLVRQQVLLALLGALGGRAANRDFQELLFLFSQEHPTAGLYEFVPCKYGAFSFTSYADRRELSATGFLVDTEAAWQMTEAGHAAIKGHRRHAVDGFAQEFGHLHGDALVREAYLRHPYYAIRSEVAERVFANDASALRSIDQARGCSVKASLMSIGYQGRSLEGYLNELVRAGVSQLIDVRRNPSSRQYGFSKGALDVSCQSVGILYRHLPELGIAPEGRRSLRTQSDFDAVYENFVRDGLPQHHAVLAEIAAWIRAGERIALTCYERDPGRAHRRCVAGVLEKSYAIHTATVHL